jgi:WD40 repeat protein
MKQPVKVLELAGYYLISSSADCKIRTWTIDEMSGELALKATLKGHGGPPTCLKTDGDILFSLSSRDETLRTWSLSVWLNSSMNGLNGLLGALAVVIATPDRQILLSRKQIFERFFSCVFSHLRPFDLAGVQAFARV